MRSWREGLQLTREQAEGATEKATLEQVPNGGEGANWKKSREGRANMKTPRLLLGRTGSLCVRRRESSGEKPERDWRNEEPERGGPCPPQKGLLPSAR